METSAFTVDGVNHEKQVGFIPHDAALPRKSRAVAMFCVFLRLTLFPDRAVAIVTHFSAMATKCYRRSNNISPSEPRETLSVFSNLHHPSIHPRSHSHLRAMQEDPVGFEPRTFLL